MSSPGRSTIGRKTGPKEGQAPAYFRLRGWIERRLNESGGRWIHLDIVHFALACHLSIRHAKRALAELRKQSQTISNHQFTFRTVHSGRAWKVIVASTAWLAFDREPLYRKRNGMSRHVRPSLRQSKIAPRCALRAFSPRSKNSAPSPVHTTEKPAVREDQKPPFVLFQGGGVSDNSPIQRDSYESQQIKQYGGKPAETGKPIPEKLRLLAFAMISRGCSTIINGKPEKLRGLESIHWDNCKVWFSKRAAWSYAARALAAGHSTIAIIHSYDRALHQAHGTATDKGIRMSPALAIWLARRTLAQDGRTVEARRREIYKREGDYQKKVMQQINPPSHGRKSIWIDRSRTVFSPRSFTGAIHRRLENSTTPAVAFSFASLACASSGCRTEAVPPPLKNEGRKKWPSPDGGPLISQPEALGHNAAQSQVRSTDFS